MDFKSLDALMKEESYVNIISGEMYDTNRKEVRDLIVKRMEPDYINSMLVYIERLEEDSSSFGYGVYVPAADFQKQIMENFRDNE